MIRKKIFHIFLGTIQAGLVMLLLGACSTTKHLPEGEVLYTGSKTIIENRPQAPLTDDALTELDAALEKAPSTKVLGFIPIPFKMWAYNSLVHYKKGFGRWLFNRFAANPPVFISTVNPEIRAKVGTNLLHDYGYFNGTVRYQTLPDKKDSLKASIRYTVDMKDPYYIDTVYYTRFNPRTLRIMERGRRGSLLTPGEQFNVSDLDEERSRISALLRNRGYFYFRPDYMKYQADTLLNPGHVSLRLIPVPGLPEAAQRPYYVGKTSVFLYGKGGEVPNSTLEYRGLDIHYYKKMQVRPNMLYRWLNYQAYVRNDSLRNSAHSRLYSQYRQTRIQERLSQLSIFRYLDLQYIPQDSTATCDTLNVRLQATFDKPYDAELEFNLTTKSNNQTGPGASFGLTRYNVFGGGETWNVKLKGSYEWQTGQNKGSSLMNSWEMGVSTALTFPRVVFPSFGGREYDFPATTTFRLYIDQLNRAKYYKLLAFGGNATYDFQPTRTSRHSLTPLRVTFNVLQHTTKAFEEIAEQNKALYRSLQNQFIPAMEYTYTFDNAALRGVRNPIWWQTTFTSAGNITSGIYRIFGQKFSQKDKKLFGVPFAQFLKVNSDFRYTWKIDKNQSIASRVAGGIIWAYGNTNTAPYSEQFYIGGANSVRAFTARSIGPGGFRPTKTSKGLYLDQTGDIRMEANVEYRFRIYGDLHGAVFLDAGNVWMLRKDDEAPEKQLRWKTFGKQIALGTGTGLRYDLDFLILRLDCGVPLHDPYDTGKKGYYNVTGSFWKGLGVHFAVGYPF
ncbi:BamA/TamA family outer membrane protein [Bacteroides fragilis]|jgi:outer membrane protein assembly factor BamA|uniref:translocation and assembly module lipoprotein TamL n=1 Tax=Bacteroides fragilis TaxID=817 RepID=UPI001C73D185|nr:BamA/TamA family outer membrane protein [Bacteroides fragilis]MCF2689640.1 BamA/TamA family outer membrane protein [Bacteroides fragilis]MCM0253182.1 BamA/TamA family outer membrane protein [Bacteroides fragilis]MCM0296930.1 BamA/TamA family outer membrane protein [Bacteroides fragilis]MCM0337461.1 BamA/TamA family outer membrane protein [Bacteroides fragilis]